MNTQDKQFMDQADQPESLAQTFWEYQIPSASEKERYFMFNADFTGQITGPDGDPSASFQWREDPNSGHFIISVNTIMQNDQPCNIVFSGKHSQGVGSGFEVDFGGFLNLSAMVMKKQK